MLWVLSHHKSCCLVLLLVSVLQVGYIFLGGASSGSGGVGVGALSPLQASWVFAGQRCPQSAGSKLGSSSVCRWWEALEAFYLPSTQLSWGSLAL